MGHGGVDSTRAGGSTLPPTPPLQSTPPHPTPPQQAVTLGTLRPRHQRPGSKRAHTHTHLHLHPHTHTHRNMHAHICFHGYMYGPSNEPVHTWMKQALKIKSAHTHTHTHREGTYAHTRIPIDQTRTQSYPLAPSIPTGPSPGCVIVLKI